MVTMTARYAYPLTECEALEAAVIQLEAAGIEVDECESLDLLKNRLLLDVVGGRFDGELLAINLDDCGNPDNDPTFNLAFLTDAGQEVPVEASCPLRMLLSALADVQEDYSCRVEAL